VNSSLFVQTAKITPCEAISHSEGSFSSITHKVDAEGFERDFLIDFTKSLRSYDELSEKFRLKKPRILRDYFP